jgi:hypothetical protein
MGASSQIEAHGMGLKVTERLYEDKQSIPGDYRGVSDTRR